MKNKVDGSTESMKKVYRSTKTRKKVDISNEKVDRCTKRMKKVDISTKKVDRSTKSMKKSRYVY